MKFEKNRIYGKFKKRTNPNGKYKSFKGPTRKFRETPWAMTPLLESTIKRGTSERRL